jgi:hypothetical protein
MKGMKISPEIERIYQQLLWADRRRARIITSVAAHFGSTTVQRILSQEKLTNSKLVGEPDFHTLLDERAPPAYLAHLAHETEALEAATVSALRKHVSVYQQHVDEQILFGTRTAGQEAGRSFLARSKLATKGRTHLDVPEAIQAVFDLTYNGLPWEKDYFLCLRALGGSTVHYIRSPHLAAWRAAGGDPKFMFSLKSEWIRGMLDILSPETEFSTSHSIEQGERYGLAQFHLREQHAGP